jgi:NADH-quinone oxidoreductase subunit L
VAGIAGATIIYLGQALDPAELQATFRPLHALLWNKWFFDELYWVVFVRPALFIAAHIAWFDRNVIDTLLNGLAALTRGSARAVELILDQRVVDGSVNAFANWTWDFGLLLRKLQTGSLRQYVLFIVMGTWFMCLAYFAVSYVLS